MKLIRLILFPFSLIYGFLVFIYHKLYDMGILPSKQFNIPIISVGNLTVGGTGKTPHVEYLIRLLMPEYGNNIATLSRGYGRVTSGFFIADNKSDSFAIGDEPMQFKNKFPEIKVAVDEKRVRGINMLLQQFPTIRSIILDDAFQHRALKPGLSILLMDHDTISQRKMLLPTGTLREWSSGAKRADIIVVTNTPVPLSPIEQRRIQNEINPLPHQKLRFSYVQYGDVRPVLESAKPLFVSKKFYFERNYSILLVTGIANPGPLIEYYRRCVRELIHIRFPDHHKYSTIDLQRIQKNFDNIVNQNKIILTTEKDAMRLAVPGLKDFLEPLPIFFIPIEVKFHAVILPGGSPSDNGDNIEFNQQIIDYVARNQRYNRFH